MVPDIFSGPASVISSIFANEIHSQVKRDFLEKVTAESVDQKLIDRIRAENDPFDSDLIDSFLAEERIYLSQLLSSNTRMNRILLENVRNRFRKKYPQVNISDKQFLEYVQQARSNLLQSLSSDAIILCQILEQIQAEIQRNHMDFLENLDHVTEQLKRWPPIAIDPSHRTEDLIPTQSLLIQQPNQYLTHTLTLHNGVRYIFSSAETVDILPNGKYFLYYAAGIRQE